MHPVSGQDRGVLGGPEVVVALRAVILHPPRFDPAHLDGMNQFGHLLLLHQRRDEAAFVFRSVGNRVDHHLRTEELHLRLRRRDSNKCALEWQNCNMDRRFVVRGHMNTPGTR